jgi:hypothetical protein
VTEERDWDAGLAHLTKAIGPTNFSEQAEFIEDIMEWGKSMQVDKSDRQYTPEQINFLRTHYDKIRTHVQSWMRERGAVIDDSKELWMGDFLFTFRAYKDYYASVSFFPAKNNAIAYVSFSCSGPISSPLTGELIESWTTIETVQLDLGNPDD